MSHGSVDLERPYRFVAADGTTYWSGLLRAGEVWEVQNAEASATIAAGEAVRLDGTNTVFPRWDLSSTADAPKTAIHVLRLSASGNLFLPGVAIENIPAGGIGRIAGPKSLVACLCINPPNSNVVGSAIQSSATVAKVTANTAPGAFSATAVHTQPGLALGLIAKPAGIIAGTIGSADYVGAFVTPF